MTWLDERQYAEAGHKRAIADLILSFAGFDDSIDNHIKTILDVGSSRGYWHDKNQVPIFNNKDNEYNGSLMRRFKHLVTLTRKIDAKKKYLPIVDRVLCDFKEANIIRNSLAHRYSTIINMRSQVFSRISIPIERETIFGYPMTDLIRYDLSTLEIEAISNFVKSAQMTIFHCAIEIMYDYDMKERDGVSLVPTYQTNLWPHLFHDRPYPWRTDRPTLGKAAPRAL